MQRKPKTLIMNIRYACPIDLANVPEVLARIAGKDGHAVLVSTDVERGDLAAYKARRDETAETPAVKPAKRKAKPTAERPMNARLRKAAAGAVHAESPRKAG
jgi:hypothetical protein